MARNIGCVVIIIGLLSWCATVNREADQAREAETAQRSAIPDFSPEARAQCRELVARSVQRREFIEVKGGTARVRRRDWAELTTDEKSSIIATLACSQFGRPVSGLTGNQFVQIDDAVTGDRLALATGGYVDID